MAKSDTSKINYAVPGKPMSKAEMEQMIKEAENGKFHSMRAVRGKVEKWKIKYKLDA
jgi:hypothetical protein